MRSFGTWGCGAEVGEGQGGLGQGGGRVGCVRGPSGGRAGWRVPGTRGQGVALLGVRKVCGAAQGAGS